MANVRVTAGLNELLSLVTFFAAAKKGAYKHEHYKPIGHVEFAHADKRGIGFRARRAQCDEPGALRDQLEEAWQNIKVGLVRGVSIGFRPIKMEPCGNGSNCRA